jgi:hypothetical protein
MIIDTYTCFVFIYRKIIVRAQLIQLLRGLVTKNLNQRISGPNCNGKGRASPVITLLLILLHWIRISKELQSPLRLLGMAFKLCRIDIAPWQPGC